MSIPGYGGRQAACYLLPGSDWCETHGKVHPPAPVPPTTPNGTGPVAAAVRAIGAVSRAVVPQPRVPQRSALEFVGVRALRAQVAAAGPRQWLVSGLWPGDAYGVIAAPWKSAKTWHALDLALSVTSGTPWLGSHQIGVTGPVVCFLGEGGPGNVLRRIDAVAAAKGVVADDQALTVCCRAPDLTDAEHEALIRDQIAKTQPRLIVVDPLYLAMRGQDHRSLYAMGDALGRMQALAEQARAALVVVTHYNRDGSRKGSDRISGAGPAEWGRVVGTADLLSRSGGSITCRWEFIGGEISSAAFNTRTTITATGPELTDALTYAVEVVQPERDGPDDGLSVTQRRVLAAVTGRPGCTVRQIGDDLAADGQGPPLRPRTIQTALAQMSQLVRGSALDARGTTVWEVVQDTP